MYTQQQVKDFQQLTQALLWKVKEGIFDISGLEQLRDILRFHEYRYYIQNDPLLVDADYDILYKQLEKTEQRNPLLITPDSPTQRVGSSLNTSFNTVQHLVPMLSLENSYNAEDLLDWDKSARVLAGQEAVEYCVEPKFDGASISLIYENDLLIRAATRGDGVEGEDVTTNIRQIKSVPLSARFSLYGIQQIEIRGEVLMNKNNFKAYNDKLAEQNQPPLANPRNAASGSLRMKDPREVGKRNLEAFLYHVSYYTITEKGVHAIPDTHAGMLQMLWALGFRSPAKELFIAPDIQGIIEYTKNFEEKRDSLGYEIDGMVVKVNNLNLQDKMGMTTHHPRWAMAFKFKARQATSLLRNVEFQVGRTGSITPVAKIDPVHIGGVTVSSISLFNEDVIREKDLHIGDTVLVERAGDVIPYIVKPLAELRTGKEEKIVFPATCPVCHDPLVKPEEEAVWRCTNFNCAAQVVERMIHFVSKDAMDIKSFGEANVRKFYEMGLLKSLPDIYHLDFEAIGKLEGFGAKSVEKLKAAIEVSKAQPLHRLIFALGIRYVGETTAKTLAQRIHHLLELKDLSQEELLGLEDVGVKVAASVYSFFHNEDNIGTLEALEKAGVQLKNNHKQLIYASNLLGKSFLFTGTLEHLKRSEAEEMVEKKGGKIVSGVSSKLDYLVVGTDAGSKLEKAKKIASVKIVTEEDFIKMLAG